MRNRFLLLRRHASYLILNTYFFNVKEKLLFILFRSK